MGLHYFYANMTLEMVCCSVGIWGIMHLIASSERVCIFIRTYLYPSLHICVYVHGVYSFSLSWCFIYSSPAMCDPGICCRRYCGILLQWVQMLYKGLMSSALNCHLKTLNQKHCTPKSQNTVATPQGTRSSLLSLCWSQERREISKE